MITLFNMLLGEFEWDAMIQSEPIWAPVWFCSFYVLMFYLCLNMLLAIVMDAYSEVKEAATDLAPPMSVDLYAMTQTNWRLVMGRCCCTRAKYADQPLTYDDMIVLIETRGFETRVFTGPHELESLFGIGSWMAEHIFDDCDDNEEAREEDSEEREVTMADLRELEVRAAKRMDKHFEELLTAIHSLAAAKTGGLTPQG